MSKLRFTTVHNGILQSDADVSNFYQTEMKTLVGQQEMRYRFFVDKQREWADAYVELYKHFDELYAGETRPAVAPVPETRFISLVN